MSGRNTAHEELVFCHACNDEFYKQGSNLTCRTCGSDFTELVRHRIHGTPYTRPRNSLPALRSSPRPSPGFGSLPMRRAVSAAVAVDFYLVFKLTVQIDPDFDPRSEDEPEFHGHGQWAQARDPDEADIDDYARDPPRRDRGGPQVLPDPTSQAFNANILGPFSQIFQNITGQRAPRPQNQPPDTWRSPFDPFPPGFGRPPAQTPGWNNPRQQPQPQPQAPGNFGPFGRSGGTSASYSRSFPSGVSISFTSSGPGGSWTRSTGRGPDPAMPHDEFYTPPGQQNPNHNPAAAFHALIGQMFNRQGDVVFSESEFDRVLSRAPGPASSSAIDALPRKKVTDEMLDENTKQAECSICMENVSVGEEVTSLPCNHWFHHECVGAWLREHDTCPVCRAGIMPKNGAQDQPRSPNEAPLHDEDPVMITRRESGTRENPYVVPESPTEARRRPNPRRHSSSGEQRGFTGRVRNFFERNNGDNSQRRYY